MEELKEVLELHEKWLNNEKGGIRANLSYANLICADLNNCNLSGVNLKNADLRNANLSNCNLSGADLRNANLVDVDLRFTNLSRANLTNANLEGANLREVILKNTNLNGIKYNYLSIGLNLVCPEKGSYIGYKKAKNKYGEEVIVELLITEDALRSSATTRKCRCSKAKVLSITSLDKTKSFDKAYSNWDKTFIYKVGETVEVDNFNTNRWYECSTGIHHFITRKEAVEY